MISTDEAKRIGVMAARLQAGNDQQVLSAARMLVRALDEHGLRIGDLIADVLRPRAADMGRGGAAHHRTARACLARPWLWSAYELQFLFDITHLAGLSAGQAAKLERLIARMSKA